MSETDAAIERTQGLAQSIAESAMRYRADRLDLVRIHAGTKLAMGLLILFTGGLPTIESLVGVWTRTALGLGALIGGLVLLVGVCRKKLVLAGVGLVLIGLWDVAMVAGVAVTVILGGVEFVMPWEPLPLTAPRPYVAAVYAALALMIWGVHIPALVRAFRRETLQ